MTAWQSVGFDFLTKGVPGAERGFLSLGRAASASSDDVMGLARRLDDVSGKIAKARVELAGDKEALAQLDKLSLKMLAVSRKVTGDVSIEGAAKASLEITGLDAQLDKLGSTSKKATVAVGSGASGLAGVSGMGALIGAGVALSPVIATVATGTAGFGLAAAGAVAPVVKAAQAAGGLEKNMSKLDPEQKKVARGLLGLGQQYRVFEKALEPQVLTAFSGGLRIAGHLLEDLQPVSQATGKAIGTLLGRVDQEFQSGTWQNFFGFMASTAGPDVKLVGDNLIELMNVLPPLLQDLQPVGTAFLTVSDDALKFAAASAKAVGGLTSVNKQAADTPKKAGVASQAFHLWEQGVRGLEDVTKNMVTFIFPKLEPGIRGVASATGKAGQEMHGTAAQAFALSSSLANPGPFSVGGAADAAKPRVVSLATSVKQLTAAMAKNVSEVLTLQGDEVQWRQSLQAADKQLRSNSAGLDGNTKNALANKAAVLQATQNVVIFANDQLTLGGNLRAASGRIQDQITWLQKHGEKSRFARREIHALRMEEEKIRATIRQRMIVKASGDWDVNPSGSAPSPGIPGGGPGGHGGPEPKRRTAAGWRVPGFGGGDRWPALLEGGEAVVPKHLVPPLAPFLKANQVPGFAAGGVAGSFSGSVPGLTGWLRKEDNATLLAFENAVARATLAGIRAAQAGAGGGGFGVPGPGGGQPSANAALARRMFPSVDFASWNYVAMRESGWNQFARNPSSGAYGIPQALPPSKMGPAANPPQSNVMAQLSWMAGYMNSRYGGAGGAAAHERAFNWYDSGTQWLPPGPSLAWNGTGRPERVGGEDLAPLLRQVIAELRKLPGVQAAQMGRVLSGRPVAPRPSVFAAR